MDFVTALEQAVGYEYFANQQVNDADTGNGKNAKSQLDFVAAMESCHRPQPNSNKIVYISQDFGSN